MHLSQWTLELLAEEALPPEQQKEAEEHLEACCRCSEELQAYRTLASTLSRLPRFEPSPGFSEQVMARVSIAPAPLAVRARQWLPSTGRGWSLLVAAASLPAISLMLLATWISSQLAMGPMALIRWGQAWLQDVAWVALASVTEWAVQSRVATWVHTAAEALGGLPAAGVLVLVALIGLGIPLSLWALFRLLRTPEGGAVHAH